MATAEFNIPSILYNTMAILDYTHVMPHPTSFLSALNMANVTKFGQASKLNRRVRVRVRVRVSSNSPGHRIIRRVSKRPYGSYFSYHDIPSDDG